MGLQRIGLSDNIVMERKEKEASMEDKEAKASIDIWRYVNCITDMAVVRCAIDLKLPEAVENHKSQPVTLEDLSTAVSCSPSLLRRIMRYLCHQDIFKEVPTGDGLTGYVNTHLSRRMMISSHDDKSMAPMILLASSPVMLAPWQKLSTVVSGEVSESFEMAHGKGAWAYAAEEPDFNKMFNEAMAGDSRRVVSKVAHTCADAFSGVSTMVDVGGGTGESLGILSKVFPWIRSFNYDLPHVVETAQKFEGVENLGGNMFDYVPHTDLVFIKWILHDWNDEDCIKILRRCREAIMHKEKGKVMIVEAVVGEKKEDKLEHVRLSFDMIMMTHMSKGKERDLGEWGYVLREAGFLRHEVRDINDVQSVIIAYIS